MNKNFKFGLSNNQLKVIALITMTLDHIGFILFPQNIWLRIIGRLSFPIFAYMLTEGYAHTRNKTKYSFTILTLGLIFQLVYFLLDKSLYLNIFLTYSLSLLLMYSVDCFKNKNGLQKFIIFPSLIITFMISEGINLIFPNIELTVDYGFLGALLPVFLYLTSHKYSKLVILFFVLFFIGVFEGGIQLLCLFAIPLLCLYNEKKGKMNLKYLFYIYYPLHLVIIYIIDLFM